MGSCRSLRLCITKGVSPKWVQGYLYGCNEIPKPARVRLILGKTELLPGMDIIRKLDIAVRFGGAQFKVGQSEWEMTTFHEKYHWVFPLVPSDCDYAKLNEYFGKLQNSEIEVLQVQ